MREKLDTWPTLPVIIEQHDDVWESKWGVVDIAAALEQNNQICQIGLWGVPNSQMEEILAGMHKPFPILTHLWLESDDETVSVNPVSFLGESVPCLQFLQLVSIPFPRLPKLLLSVAHLTDLRLFNISHSGYISPEEMVSCFFTLTKLETIILKFDSPKSFPIREHRRPPLPTHISLPALTLFQFNGVNEYLEDLMVRIDTPLLDKLTISLFH